MTALSRGHLPRRRTAWILGVTMLMLVSVLLGAGFAGAGSPTAPVTIAPTSALEAHGPASPSSSARPVVPATGGAPSSGPGTFWTTGLVPQPTFGNYSCAYQFVCLNYSGNPAIAANGAGVLVTAETSFTNATVCASNPAYTWTEVGVSASTDGGATWSYPQFLGNPGCQDAGNYTSAMWPALVALANDTFVLAYLQYNLSSVNACTNSAYYYFPALAPCYVRADRLVVSQSYDNGTSWTTPTVVDAVLNPNLNQTAPIPAQPALATDGTTVYLAWTNWTNPYFEPFSGPGTSVGLWLANSTNGGSTFGNATALPVQTGTYQSLMTWVAYGPSLAVNSTGAVSVAYSTDYNYVSGQLCQPTGCGYLYSGSGGTMSVVVATSTDRGATFTLRTVGKNVPVVWNGNGLWTSYGPGSLVSPAPAIGINPTTDEVYVAYTGGAFGTYCYAANSCVVGGDDYFQNLWVANSTTGGLSWSTPAALGDTLLGIYGAAKESEQLFTPSVAIGTNGTVYVNVAMENASACTVYCDLWTDEMFVSTNAGASFPSVYDLGGTLATIFSYPMWDGIDTSMTTLGGVPYAAWTWQACPTNGATYCGSPSPTDYSQVAVSTLFDGTGVRVTFNETGLPASASWSVNLDGNVRSGPAGTNLSVTRVPTGTTLGWTIANISTGTFGLQYAAVVTPTSPAMFNNTTVVSAQFEEFALLEVSTVPPPFPGYVFPCSLSLYLQFCANQDLTPGVGPSWLPLGATVDYGITSSALPAYCYGCMNLTFAAWTGTGAGSWNTTLTNGTTTLLGPVNETASFTLNNLCSGSTCFNLTYAYNFTEVGLPANTTWAVTLGNDTNTTARPWIEFNATFGPLPFTVSTVTYNSTYAWVGIPDYRSPITATQGQNVTVRFQLEPLNATAFAVNFSATGVPASATGWGLVAGGNDLGIANSPTGTTLDLPGGSPGTTINATDVYGSAGVGGQLAYFEVTPFTVDALPYQIAAGGSLQLTGPADVVAAYTPLYWVDLPAPANGSVSAASQWVGAGGTLSVTATPQSGYSFVGWTGSGTGSKTTTAATINVTPGSPVTEVATFAPILPTYSVTVTASGLPADQPISIVLGATTYTGASPLTIVGLPPAVYALDAPSLVRNGTVGEQYFATGLNSSLSLVGGLLNVSGNGTITVAYATEYLLTIDPTVNGTVAPAPGSYWELAGSAVSLAATPATGFLVVGWVGYGTGSSTTSSGTTSVTMSGPVTEAASFVLYVAPPAPVYTLTLTPAGLPSSVAWSASIGAQALEGVGPLVFTGLSGNVTVSVATVSPATGVQYVPSTAAFSVDVASNMSLSQPSFATQYLVTVAASSGGSVTPSTSWVAAGSAISLSALPGTGYAFVNWTGTGSGAYSGTLANTSFTVSAPISEFANFQPLPTTTTSGSGGSVLIPIAALVVLLVVGLLVGLLIARSRGGRAPPAPVEPAPSTPTGSGSTGTSSDYSDASQTVENEGDGEVVYGGGPPH